MALVTTLLGLSSRRFAGQLPGWVGLYAGDALWALLVYWLLGLLLPHRAPAQRAAWAAGCALLIELSQLWQAPWLNGLRRTTLGALVLGRGFLWSDLLCYAVGVGMGFGLEWLLRRRAAHP